VTDEVDGGLVDGEAGDVDLAAEDQRDHVDVDADTGGLEDRLVGEGRVVGETGVLGFEASGPDGEVELTERNLAAEGFRELAFDSGSEAVGVQEKRNRQHNEHDEGEDAAEGDQ
jgi:hypothetical protein